MWTNNNFKYLIGLSIILLIGFTLGLFFLNNIDESSKEIVLNNINDWVINLSSTNINYILSHLIVLALFIFCSSFIIGIPLYIFYIFYNGFSLGFIVSTLFSIFKLKGIFYSILYLAITKVIFIILLLFLIKFLIRIGEKSFYKVIKKIKNKEEINILYKKCLIILGIIFLNDVIIYFWGAKLLNIFNFLII